MEKYHYKALVALKYCLKVGKISTKTEKMSLERLVKQGTDLEVSEEDKYRRKGKKHKVSLPYKTHAREIKTK